MGTPLGGASTQSMRLMVKNEEGATIKRGTCVSWSSIAAGNPAVTFLNTIGEPDDYTPNGGTNAAEPQIPYVTVKDSVADSTTLGGAAKLGVAATDILDGEYGEVICFGLAKVLCNAASPAAGEVVTADIDGEAIDAATASHKNPFGILMEQAVANELKWAFVNFIGSATGCGGAAFMGKGY